MEVIDLEREIASRSERAYDFIRENLPWELSSEALSACAWHYLRGGGKGLRPALLMLCCGAVGGDERRAVPAAASVEVAHNWTLVHDDIMDRDELRRGRPTAHAFLREKARGRGLPLEEAEHYGLSMALTAGDLMHAWSVLLCLKLADWGVPSEVVLAVVGRLERAMAEVIEGQAMDLDLSRAPLKEVDREEVMEMMRKKTASLLEFCATAGAMIGKGRVDDDFPEARALSLFARKCGLAFQLKDDLLGLFGSEEEIGKPVGSDIEEGKRTLLVVEAYKSLDGPRRERLEALLGKKGLSPEELEEFRDLVEQSGSRERVERVAQALAEEGKGALRALPESPQKMALEGLAEFVVSRGR